MNILFLFGHNLVVGGHFKSAQAFINELVKEGHHVHVMAPGGEASTIHPFYENGATFSSIIITNSKNRIINSLRKLFVLNKQIKQVFLKSNFDIIHAQDSSIMIEGYKIASFYRKPFILTQAGGRFFNVNPPSRAIMILYSQELFNNYRNLNLARKLELNIISERINHRIYKPGYVQKKVISNFRLPDSGFNLFFSMRLHSQKESWINTLLYFAGKIEFPMITNYIIVGDGALLNYMKEIAKDIEDMRQNVKFYFLGAINKDLELVSLINYSNICIGNGRSLIEAMACGKPVIILGENNQFELVDQTNIEIIKEYNFSGRHFSIVEYNESGQKNKLECLMKQSELKCLSEFSLNHFEKFLSANIGAEKLLRVYYNAIKKNNHKKNNMISYLMWLFSRSVKSA